MARPPSIYSPEYFKPQKPENHSCCGGGCQPAEEPKVVQKRGCSIRYKSGGNASYKSGGGATYKGC